MCGVVGYSSQDPIDEHYSILHKLIYQSKIRGLHSFGYSYCLNNKLTTRKYHNVDEVVSFSIIDMQRVEIIKTI